MNKLIRMMGIGLASFVFFAILGCEKHKAKTVEVTPKVNFDSLKSAQHADHKKSSLKEIHALDQHVVARIDSAKKQAAKLGNKTRKKIKPTLDAVDSKIGNIHTRIVDLDSLAEPEFSSAINKVKLAIDSISLDLSGLKKYWK